MQSLLLSREMLSGDRSPPTPFNVVIMYEDFGTEKRAKKGLYYVASPPATTMSCVNSLRRKPEQMYGSWSSADAKFYTMRCGKEQCSFLSFGIPI